MQAKALVGFIGVNIVKNAKGFLEDQSQNSVPKHYKAPISAKIVHSIKLADHGRRKAPDSTVSKSYDDVRDQKK